jgi:regulatory protein
MPVNPIRISAMNSLARREHSRVELQRKLIAKGFEPEAIEPVLDDLIKENLLSDQRFTEAYVRMRANSGYGPVRIKQELQERCVDIEVIATTMEQLAEEWLENARATRAKKFGPKIPEIFLERAKQMKYLQYKGFDLDQIKTVMRLNKLYNSVMAVQQDKHLNKEMKDWDVTINDGLDDI